MTPMTPERSDVVLTGPTGIEPTGRDTLPEQGVPWAWGRLPLPAAAGPARWTALVGLLAQHPALWQDAEYLLLLDDDVQISAADVSTLFRLMREGGLSLAQPSLSWRSHFTDPTTLHNPSFVLRHTNRLDAAALAFSREALQRALPLIQALPHPEQIARVLPAAQAMPWQTAAVVDAVQVERTAEPCAEPAIWPDELAEGPHAEPGTTWGGLSIHGDLVSLFQTTREHCLGLVAAGFAAAVQEPQPIGEVFLQHHLRSLAPPPEPLRLGLAPASAPSSPAHPPLPVLRRSPIVEPAAHDAA